MGERRRLLERLQQRVLALLGHRLGGLDHEDAAVALERAIGDLGDHALADGLDQVLDPGRAQPDQVGVRRGIGERAPAGFGGVGGALGEQLGGQRPRRLRLAGARRAGEQVGVEGIRGRGREGDPGGGLVAGRIGDRRRHGGGRVHRGLRSRTAATTRRWTSSGSPAASTTTIRPGLRSASSP